MSDQSADDALPDIDGLESGQVRELLALGRSMLDGLISAGWRGPDIYLWHCTGIPVLKWASWAQWGIEPQDAAKYYPTGVSAGEARREIDWDRLPDDEKERRSRPEHGSGE